jgi:hypothetical protein
MADVVFQILDLLRSMKPPESSWSALLKTCAKGTPSKTWKLLPLPKFSRDIKSTADWLTAQIAAHGANRPGIYLGLDTLNMSSGPKKNLEIGFSSKADPSKLNKDFIYDLDERGDDHLIASLRDMKGIYDESDISSPADYQLFLGYTGIVLLTAFEQITTPDFIAVWGFHDGDLFLLCRKSKGKFQRLVKL